MRTSSVSHLLVLALGVQGTPSGGLSASALLARDLQVRSFEEGFLDKLALDWQHSNDTVKLVGYKKIVMSDRQRDDLESRIHTHPDEWAGFSSAFYDHHERTMRVYFPVENALVYHDGELVEATHMGEYPHLEHMNGDCAVVGRYQTDKVHGVQGNRIEDGIIYLAEPAMPVRTYGDGQNVLVYDFGWREGAHDHSHSKRSEGQGGSCKQNHGGKVCSQVYGINNGRCPRDYSRCIDYNGWIPNCKDYSAVTAFPGSDCFNSVAMGHCWNELPI